MHKHVCVILARGLLDPFQVAFVNCTFSDNSLSHPHNAHGGAVYVEDGTVTVRDCLFARNNATAKEAWGGALHVSGGNLTVESSRFVGNAAKMAASCVVGCAAEGGSVYVTNDAKVRSVCYILLECAVVAWTWIWQGWPA